MLSAIVNAACAIPVGSKLKIGNTNLESIVNIGWKMYMGNVLRPMYSKVFFPPSGRNETRYEEKHRKQTAQARMDIAPQSWKYGLLMSNANGTIVQRLLL